jgi:hypothetical protein
MAIFILTAMRISNCALAIILGADYLIYYILPGELFVVTAKTLHWVISDIKKRVKACNTEHSGHF